MQLFVGDRPVRQGRQLHSQEIEVLQDLLWSHREHVLLAADLYVSRVEKHEVNQQVGSLLRHDRPIYGSR